MREAARTFEDASVARTERSIINWCTPNKQGISRLDCYYEPNDHKYFITPQSVERVIEEEKAKMEERFPHGSETHAEVPNPSEPDKQRPQGSAESVAAGSERAGRLKELE